MGIKICSSLKFNELLHRVTSKDNIDKQVQKIEDYLKNKYGEEFEVLRYGDREDKYNDDIKIICKSKSNPDVIFYAKGNSLGEFDDNYCDRYVFTELEQSIKKEFANNNYDINVKIDNTIKNKLDNKIQLVDYIKTNSDQLFLAYIVIKGEIASDVVWNAINAVKSSYPGIKLKSFVYRMNPTNFENYCKFSNSNESTSRTIIQKYLPSKVEVIEE